MRCPNCDTDNRDQAKFCDECGFPLTGAIARVASAAKQEGESNPLADDSLEMTAALDLDLEEQPINGEEPQDETADTGEEALEEAESVQEEIAPIAQVDIETVELAEQDEALEAKAFELEESLDEQATQVIEADVSLNEQKTQAIDADLSGFDRSYDYGERLVDPGYQEPTVDWRDGGTMKLPSVEGEVAKGHDFLESSQKKKSNKPKIIAGSIAGVIALIAIIAFATYQMQLWGGIAVPNVTGMTEADAIAVLEEQGFAVRSTQVKSDDTEGLVLVMDPDVGSRAAEGSEVIIHISTAREVPAIVDKTTEEAQKLIDDEGFTNVVWEKEYSDKPKGTVLSVKPEVGTRAKSAQEIIVKVAEPYVVPDVAGMYLQEAQTTIEQAGLAHDIQYVNTTDYPDGQIMGSSPAAGTQVKGDTVVVIQIARARGAELEELTRSYLAPGNSVTIGLNNYAIESLDSVQYAGNETVNYVMTARPFTYILGETVSISARQISGSVTWNEDNTIASIS